MELVEQDIEEIVERIRDVASPLSGRTILITGARGFLGNYFIHSLIRLNEKVLDKPCHIIGVDNFITSSDVLADEEHLHYEFVQHDVTQPLDLEKQVDFVIHAAGIASPFYYRAYPLQTIDVSVTGTRHLLELCRQMHSRFVFMSSSEIYGDPDPRFIPIPESYRGNVSPLGPRACYDESKRLGETLCQIYHNLYGVHTNMIRPFNVYGPGMKEKDYRVLPNFASRIKAGKPLKVYGHGRQTRTYCYITDAMVGFFRVLLKGIPGEPYNIGNSQPEITVLDLARTIQEVLDREVEIVTVPHPDTYPPDEPQRRCPDITKAQLQLGYEPSVSLEEGLRRFFAWTDKYYTGQM